MKQLAMLKFGILTWLICVSACEWKLGPWADVAQDDYIILLSRNECLGTCPSYMVAITGNGEVVFTGRKFVKFIGTRNYKVVRSQVADLIRDIDRLNIIETKGDYVGPVDQPMTCINIDAGSNRKDVCESLGRLGDLPEGIIKLQKRIDEVAVTSQFK